MRVMRRSVFAAAVGLGALCSCADSAGTSGAASPDSASSSAPGTAGSDAPTSAAAAASDAPPVVGTSTASSASAGASAPADDRAVPPGAEPCGELGCLLFKSPADAFAYVLERRPKVLGIGETHAQKGTEGITSTTKRFTNDLLPLLKDRVSDLVVELWVADGKCGKVEQQVAEQQKPVTATQAKTDQNEFVTLGTRAKELGIRPLPLRPSCEEYERIAKAGENDVSEMLMMIGRHTEADIRRLLSNAPPDGGDKMVVAYGGAMHNDLVPTEARKAWSFGPELQTATAGRYVELDLIVPEFVRDTDSWKSLVWYPHFNKDAHPERTTLFRPNPGSYVLIFPASQPGKGKR